MQAGCRHQPNALSRHACNFNKTLWTIRAVLVAPCPSPREDRLALRAFGSCAPRNVPLASPQINHFRRASESRSCASGTRTLPENGGDFLFLYFWLAGSFKSIRVLFASDVHRTFIVKFKSDTDAAESFFFLSFSRIGCGQMLDRVTSYKHSNGKN